jgi:hypothetical protein
MHGDEVDGITSLPHVLRAAQLAEEGEVLAEVDTRPSERPETVKIGE